MAKKRPSTQKRQREYQKRQRELAKAEKAAQKRERRQNRDTTGDSPSADNGEVALGSGDETTGAEE
jgi:hypothetical protein